jgi:hypothetical protein
MLCGTSFGLETSSHRDAPQGFELQRHRLFEVHGFEVSAPPCKHSGRPVVGVYGGHVRNRQRGAGANHRSGSNLPPAFAFQAMGVPLKSMTLTSLCDSIPPAYARFIAKAFIEGGKVFTLPTHQARVDSKQGGLKRGGEHDGGPSSTDTRTSDFAAAEFQRSRTAEL